MTAAEQVALNTTSTLITIPFSSNPNGENMKVRVWATASLNTTTGDQMTQIIEQSFYKAAGSTTAFTAHTNNRQTAGGIAAGVIVALTISGGGSIQVDCTADVTEATNFGLHVEWQLGGQSS